MTRWSNPNYEGHTTIQLFTLANKSTMWFPTMSAAPANMSTLGCWIRLLEGSSDRNISRVNWAARVAEEVELIHLGDTEVRVKIGAIEGTANESLGKLLEPGEVWHVPFKVHDYLSFYTSSNVSQRIEMTLAWYR